MECETHRRRCSCTMIGCLFVFVIPLPLFPPPTPFLCLSFFTYFLRKNRFFGVLYECFFFVSFFLKLFLSFPPPPFLHSYVPRKILFRRRWLPKHGRREKRYMKLRCLYGMSGDRSTPRVTTNGLNRCGDPFHL